MRKKEAETTTQRIVLGESTLVTCGAGMQVERILCGFECCYITIKNLPQDIKRTEVEEIFTSFLGIDAAEYYVVDIRTWNDKVEAKVFAGSDVGGTVSDCLHGRTFRGKILDIAVDSDTGPNKMARTADNVLTVSWKLPSGTFLVHCHGLSDAQQIVDKLHNTEYRGRTIQAELQPTRRSYFYGETNSVKVSGVPAGMWFKLPAGIYTDLASHCYVTDYPSTDHFDSKAVERDLRRTVEAMTGYQTYEVVDSNKVNAEVRILFDSWDNTKRAHDRLLQPLKSNYPKFFLRLQKPTEYSIEIPRAQYRVQRARWDSLCEWDSKKAAVVNIADNHTDRVLIRVLGDDRKEVGKLKVQVENLVAGETLDPSFWHRSFLRRHGQHILDDIGTRSNTYIRCDLKTKSLKVYGDGRAKEEALELLKERVDDLNLNKSEYSVTIDRDAVGFFRHKGLAALKDDLGDDAATLVSTPTRLIIRDGEKARRIVDRLLEESRTGLQHHTKSGQDACPVCLDDLFSPVLLGCKHAYCTECISHFLESASERKQFPLVCAGDNNNCGVPISIPVIQRFLSLQQLDQLLEAAVASYIEKRSRRFQYCTTADCKQVYRRGRGLHTCPSCLASICTDCTKVAHEGMTCDEREVLDNPAEQERRNEKWASRAGAKRCPTCRVLVQKRGGCNHMNCRCGVHFCWICLQVSDSRTIIGHMCAVQGGVDPPNVPRRVRFIQPQQIHTIQTVGENPDFIRAWVNQQRLRTTRRAPLAMPDARLVRTNTNEQADYLYAQRLQQEENLRAGLGVTIGAGLLDQQHLQPNSREEWDDEWVQVQAEEEW